MHKGWLLLLVGCGAEKFNGQSDGQGGPSGPYPTEVEVENVGGETVTVTLTSDDGSETFEDVAAGTTSEPREIAWEILDAVEVTIDAGVAQGGTVDLSRENINTVLVSDASAPEVDSQASAPPSGPPGGGGNTGW